MEKDLDIYEYRPEEQEECLEFRNNIFTPVEPDQWQAMNCTGVVARDDRGLAGFIPLQFRDQLIRPDVSIPVVYENAVGVAENRRSTGIGTRMMNTAAEFIADRAAALFVIRGGETTPGYRFYRRTGHSDLNYALEYLLPAETSGPAAAGHEVREVDRGDWVKAEEDLLRLYFDQYSGFAGGRPRGSGYWQMILDSHVFRNRGWKCLLAYKEGRISGYLTGVFGTWQNKEDLCVFESIAEDREALASLISTAKKLSISGAVRYPSLSMANPIRSDLTALGFTPGETTSQIMARLLRPDRIFSRLPGGPEFAATVSMSVTTPHRTLEVCRADNEKHTVRLAMKEHDLARLFLCRLDLAAALETESVRWPGRDPGIQMDLVKIFEPAIWVQWFSDYI